MQALVRKTGFVALAVFLVVVIAGVVVLIKTVLPFEHQRARQVWNEHRLHHYAADVAWESGWDFGTAHIEIRDGKLVAATDLTTGKPLEIGKTLGASYYGSVDNLFEIVDVRITPQWNWRNVLARYAPFVASKIDPCVPPLGKVAYDPTFGYPTELWYNNSWCATTFFNYSHVRLTNLQPLS